MKNNIYNPILRFFFVRSNDRRHCLSPYNLNYNQEQEWMTKLIFRRDLVLCFVVASVSYDRLS